MVKYCYSCMQELAAGEARCPHCGREAVPEVLPHQLRPGTVLQERYLIGSVLGQGGFGITYIGRDLLLNMRVAIKEFYPTGYANRNHDATDMVFVTAENQEFFHDGKDRFLREAKTLARFFEEEGIVRVLDYFEENNTAYIIMEYLAGVTLKQYLHERGRIPANELLPLMRPLIASLEAVHRQGIVHRDISPDNIMLMPERRLKLLDFGAAREVGGEKSLSVMLKPGYAPEEQYRSHGRQGPWTDVYALCATMYCCLTGQRPTESVERAMEGDGLLTPPSQLGAEIPPAQEKALLHGMAVFAEDRCQSMTELERGLYGNGETDDRQQNPASSAATGEEIPKTFPLDMGEVEQTVQKAHKKGGGAIVGGQGEKETELSLYKATEETRAGPAADYQDSEAMIAGADAPERDTETTIAKRVTGGRNLRATFEDIGSEERTSLPIQTRDKRRRLPILVGTMLLTAMLLFGAHRLTRGCRALDQPQAQVPELPQATEAMQVTPEPSKQPEAKESTQSVEPTTEEHAYAEAERLLADGRTGAAALAFKRLEEYGDAAERCREAWRSAIGHHHLAAPGGVSRYYVMCVCPNGTVIRTDGKDDPQEDVVEIAAGAYNDFYLHSDGTVTATGVNAHDDYLKVGEWRNIISISACQYTLLGLKSDGTVVAAGSYANIYWTDEFDDWTDIVQISAGSYHALGLRSDGTVVAAGKNRNGEGNVSDWKDIIYVAALTDYSVGVRADGSCVGVGAVSMTDFTERIAWWSDIIKVSGSTNAAAGHYLYGLRTDGTWMYTNMNEDGMITDITDLIEICPDSQGNVYGLKENGTLVKVG